MVATGFMVYLIFFAVIDTESTVLFMLDFGNSAVIDVVVVFADKCCANAGFDEVSFNLTSMGFELYEVDNESV